MKRVIKANDVNNTFGERVANAASSYAVTGYYPDNVTISLPLSSDPSLSITCSCGHTFDGYFYLLDAYDVKRVDMDKYKKIKSAITKGLKALSLSGHKDSTNICVDFKSEDSLINYLPRVLEMLSGIAAKF